MVSNQVTAERPVRPQYRVREEQEHFELQVFMPGVTRQGIDISLNGDELDINATRTNSVPEGWRVINRETRSERYELRLRLNVEIAEDKISARTEDGILYLTLPKAERIKPRQIEVQ